MRLDFQQLEKLSPELTFLPEGCGTDFWEQLYQLFKKRMIDEQANDTE